MAILPAFKVVEDALLSMSCQDAQTTTIEEIDSVDIDEDSPFGRDDCKEFIKQIAHGSNKKTWRCSICLLSNFKFKCLAEYHVISVHLQRRACTWCRVQFKTVQDVISHCQNSSCMAGDFKKLNKGVSGDTTVAEDCRSPEICEDSQEADNDEHNTRPVDSAAGHHDDNSSKESTIALDISDSHKNLVSEESLKDSDQAKDTTGKPFDKKQASKSENNTVNKSIENKQDGNLENNTVDTTTQSGNDIEKDSNMEQSEEMITTVCQTINLKKSLEHCCSRCGQKFFSQSAVKWHQIRGSGCKFHQRQAPKDKDNISKLYSLVVDKSRKVKWRMYKCLKCSTFFPNQSAVKRHIRRKHWQMKGYKCRICKRGFFDIATWKHHTNNVLGCRNRKMALEAVLDEDVLKEGENDEAVVAEVKESEKNIQVDNQNEKDTTANCDNPTSVINRNITTDNDTERSKEKNDVKKKSESEIVSISSIDMLMDTSAQQVLMSSLNLLDSTDEELTFKCRVCGMFVIGADYYKEHLMAELDDSDYRPIACKLCDRKFTDIRNLNYHTNVHHKVKCDQCLESFKSQNQLSLHKKSVHDHKMSKEEEVLKKVKVARNDITDKPDRIHRCPVCEIEFENFKSKSSHVKEHHPEGSAIVCIKCNKQYKTIRDLQYHKKVYHPEQRVQHWCTECSYKTWNKYALRQHSYKHTNHKDDLYKCAQCSLVYDSAASLARHKLIHTNIRNHICHECGKSFLQKCTLDRHLDTHTKVKRYKCALCKQKYTQSYPLTKHVKSFHPEFFDTFQKERHTSAWKNDEIEEEPVKEPKIQVPKQEFITIVQVPQEDIPSQQIVLPQQPAVGPKYRYILMNSAGEIVRPAESDLISSVATALDLQGDNMIRTSQPSKLGKKRPKAASNLIKPNKRPKQKPVSIVVPAPAKNSAPTSFALIPSTSVKPQVMTASTESTNKEIVRYMLSQGDVRLSWQDVPEDLIAEDSASEAIATDTLETPSVLTSENFDLYASLGIQDSLGEDQPLGFALQNIPEDYWYDFSQGDLNAMSSYSLAIPSDYDLQPTVLESSVVGNTSTGIAMQEPQTSQNNVANFAIPDPNLQMSTVEDIPTWAGDQMLLIQDGDNSYLVSANDLATLEGTATENSVDPGENADTAAVKSEIDMKESVMHLGSGENLEYTGDGVMIFPSLSEFQQTVVVPRDGDTLRSLLLKKD